MKTSDFYLYLKIFSIKVGFNFYFTENIFVKFVVLWNKKLITILFLLSFTLLVSQCEKSTQKSLKPSTKLQALCSCLRCWIGYHLEKCSCPLIQTQFYAHNKSDFYPVVTSSHWLINFHHPHLVVPDEGRSFTWSQEQSGIKITSSRHSHGELCNKQL